MTTTADPGAHTEEGFEAIRRRRITAEPLGYVAPLDGLRAVAVIGVLLYHARFPWMQGGYLGVSTFFTLSGFLITSLLLREWNRDDGIDLRSFWARRFRRLLPASWLTMGLIVVMGVAGAWNTDQLRALRGDLPFALLEVANWHFVFSGRSYGEVFTAPSPLEHFWSLAVEQQFYVVLPLLVLGVLRIGRHRPARVRLAVLSSVLGVLVVGSAGLNWWLARDSVDRAYFGTDSRAAELLIGALLACLLLRRLRFEGLVRAAAIVAGVLALGCTFALWNTAPLGADWMYPWGLLLTACCTAAIVLGSLQDGPLARVLALPPLLWLGRISYGVYLLHWPVFLWLSPARVGWDQWPLFALRMAVTLVGAALMFRLVENPVRTGGRLKGRRAVGVAGVAGLALLAGNVFVTRDLPDPGSLSQAASLPPAPEAPTTTAPPPPLSTAVVGDRLAASLGDALGGLEGFDVAVASTEHCGLALGGWVARADEQVERDVDRCRGERDRLVQEATAAAAEVVLVHGGLRDVTDRRLDQDAPWGGPGDLHIADFLLADVAGLVDRLGETGAEVVLVAMPEVRSTAPPPPPLPAPPAEGQEALLRAVERQAIAADMPPGGHRENDPARVAAFNRILEQVAERRGIRLVDPGEVMAEWDGGELDPAMRPDGVGYSEQAGEDIGEWLLPQLRERVEPAPPAETAPVLAPDAPLPEAPPARERRSVPPGTAPDVLVIGDSVAHGIAFGMDQWSDRVGGLRVHNAARLGCPVARGGSYRIMQDLEQLDQSCDWAEFFPSQVNAVGPEVVVLSSGIWEVVDRRLPGDDRFRHVGEPGVDRYLLREFLAAIDVLGSDGATVVVLTQPYFQTGLDQGFQDLPESETERTDRLNEILREAVAQRPGVATLIDLQAWLETQPGGQIDPVKRPDGLHFTDEYVPTIGAWLGPQLIDIATG